ncbi:MAG: hypothetical protein NZ922_02500 [Candidatus Methanomethyliaceae archaeon]|nr:hypothetical protein [Candidatus Methanomethyliaceae archaeon]MDW7971558.1 hypothetical protein [Nitrososphaerota archaeon]
MVLLEKILNKGLTTPLSTIIIVISMLTINSIVFTKAFTIALNLWQEINSRQQDVILLHNTIIGISLSNPGSSSIVYLRPHSSIICTNSSIKYPISFEARAPAGTIIAVERTSTYTIVKYAMRINPFIIPSGQVKVVVSKNIDGSISVDVKI